MTLAINNELNGSSTNVNDGIHRKDRERRRTFIKRARIIAIVGLTLAWIAEFRGIGQTLHNQEKDRTLNCDAMLLDMKTNGTAFGIYPSTEAAVADKWRQVIRQNGIDFLKEDALHVVNWVVLLSCSGLTGYLFTTRNGKMTVDGYIENGIHSQSVT